MVTANLTSFLVVPMRAVHARLVWLWFHIMSDWFNGALRSGSWSGRQWLLREHFCVELDGQLLHFAEGKAALDCAT